MGMVFSQINVTLDQTIREVPLFGIANSSMRYNKLDADNIEYDFGEPDFEKAALCINPHVMTFPAADACYFDWTNGWAIDSARIVDYVDTLDGLDYAQDLDLYSDAETPGDYFFDISNRDYEWWENADGTWNQIYIGVEDFSSFITENNIKGTFIVNMLTSSIETTMDMVRDNYENGVPFEYIELGNEFYLRGGGDKWVDAEPRNYKYDLGEEFTTNGDKDGDGFFDPGRFEFIYPTPQSFAEKCNQYIDSLSTILPGNTKYAITSKNKPDDPRSDDWTRQILLAINPQVALDTIYLTWHEYLRYETDSENPIPLTPEQVLAFPQFMHEDGRMITDSGMDPATIDQLEIDLNKKIRLWLTESAFREINYDWGEKPWIFKWAQTLVNIQNYSLMLRNPHLDIIMLQSLHGWNSTSAINHGHGFPDNVPDYDGEDSCSPYGRTASAFSIYFWNYISDGMTHMQELEFNSGDGQHLGKIQEDPEDRNNSPDVDYEYSYLLGWLLTNASTSETKGIIINIADTPKTIQYDANSPIFNNAIMRGIHITSLNSDGAPSIDQYINGDGDLHYDTKAVVSSMVIPPYSVNLFEPYYPWHVSNEGSDIDGNGSSENPFATIQHGLDVANEGDMILVSAGIYYENITWPATHGINLIGSGEEDCIIDGNQSERVILFDSGNIDSTTIVSGFTIQNGLGSTAGGGIRCKSSSPSLVNITIKNNSAPAGGGICCITDSNPRITNVLITGNTATSTGDGGGIKCKNNSSPTLTNVTIADNLATDVGGAISCKNNSNPSLVNCILWNNSPHEIYLYEYDASNSLPDTVTISYSDVLGNEAGIILNNNGVINWMAGNIDSDPLFVDSGNGDYTLQQISPCIDAGTNYFAFDGDTLINLSSDEFSGEAPDMGAFEKIFGCMDVNATNYNSEAIVDDGNCEYPPFVFTSPIEGESWCIDSTYAIKWTGGNVNDTIGRLHFSDVTANQVELTIANDIPNSGNYEWVVQVGLLGTGNKKLFIENSQQTQWTHSGIFSIVNSECDNFSNNTLYVSTDGNDLNNGSENNPFSTIQAAIDASSDGDTVLVASGTYFENVDYKKKNIVVISMAGSDSTTIDGMATGSVVIMDTTLNAVLSGFHLTNGLASAGGGVKSTAGNIKLTDLIIEGNQADYGYSIIGTRQSQIIIDDILVYDNLSSQGYLGTGLYFRDASEITINHATLINNFSSDINPAHSLKILGGTSLTLNNTILWNMDDGNVLESYNGWGDNTINVTYSDIEGGVDSVLQSDDGSTVFNWAENNIDINPLFCEPDSSNYTLVVTSPCIGTGEEGVNMGALGVGCEEILSNENDVIPSQYSLHTYPNPFNPVAKILFSIPQLGLVSIKVYDITGREIETLANRNFNPGNYSINWNASAYPSGIYFVRMAKGVYVKTQKVVLIK